MTDVGISGTVLGVVPEAEFHDHRVYLRPGDTVLLFTDGLTEAGEPAAGLLDRSGVRRVVAQAAGRPPEHMVAALQAAAEEQGVVRDDLAIVAIRVDGRG
jgi:serine phosphatase RsbU (regulator of sigma subunit)